MHDPRSSSLVSSAAFLAIAALAAALPAQGPVWLHAPVEPAGLSGEFWLQGDLDLDGDVDAISFETWGTTSIKTSFTVWSNDGTGRFTPSAPTALPAMTGLHALLADLNGDGRGDLLLSIALSPVSMGLLIFAGQAGATFAAPQTYTLPANVQVIHVGNGNGDNCADLLMTHAGPTPLPVTRWLFGAPGFVLTLGPAVGLPPNSGHCPIDVDGDGDDDVAIPIDSGAGPDVLEFHLTTPTGFQFASSLPLPGNISHNLVALDRDGDGDLDLVDHGAVVNGLALTPITNLGGGNWSVGSTQTFANEPFGFGFATDWDGDGNDDLLIREYTSSPSPSQLRHLILFRSEGAGFAHGFSLRMGGYAVGNGAGPADLDGDGHPDFLDATSVYFGDGVAASPFLPLQAVRLLDWDRDGDADGAFPGVSIHDGNLGFTAAPVTFPALPANRFYSGDQILTDLDGDGRHEVLVGVFEQIGFTTVFRGTHLLREGADFQFTFVGLAGGQNDVLYQGFVVDTDGDGDLDLINEQGLWVNNGTPFFTLLGPIATGYTPVAAADVDNDGDQDLLATTHAGLGVAVLYRTAPNTFTTTVLRPPHNSTVYGLVQTPFVDVDDDGDLDVVSPDVDPSNLSFRTVLFTNQNGVFTSSLILPYAGTALAGDIDGDGLTDLVFMDTTRTRVLRRTGPGLVYAPPVSFVIDPGRELIDLDQDGDLDIAANNFVADNNRYHSPGAGYRQQYGNGSLGAGGWRPVASLRGPIREGLTPAISLRNTLGGTLALLIFGSGPDNTPSILPGVQSYVSPIDVAFGLTLNGALGQPGAGGVDVPIGIPPGLAGVHAFVEFLVFDPTVPFAFTHSNGCELAIGH